MWRIIKYGSGNSFKLILSVLMIMQLSLPVFAQLSNNNISVKFVENSIIGSNQDLINLTVKVKNNSNIVLTASANITLDHDLELISRDKRLIRINPGDSLFLPTKLFISTQAQAGKKYQVNVALQDAEKNTIAADVCKLEVNIKKNVVLFSQVSNILLQNITDSIRIPVKIQNLGNTAQKVSLVIKYPNFIETGDFQNSIQLIIPASKDTLISLNRIITKKMFGNEGFEVSIAGLYANGELFGATYVRVQNAKNDRYFRDLGISDNMDNNSFTLSSQGIGSNNELYLLTGRGNVKLPQGTVSYNVDYTSYKNNSFAPTMLRNTFLGYEAHNMGIKAGNINKNMDINIMGKGGEFFIADTASDNKYEAGYVKNSTNLLGERYQNIFSSGEAAWGTFSHTEKKWNLKSSAIYEANNFLSIRNFLINNQFGIKGKKFYYGGSVNAGRIDQILDNPTSNYGFAGSFDLSGNIDNISIISTNFISTKYYPGSRQGATNLSERIMHNRSDGSTWASFDYYDYSPGNIGRFSFFNASFKNLNAEIGISQRLFKKITLSIAPNYRTETSSSLNINTLSDKTAVLKSWNLGATLNVPISTNQYLSINNQSGFYNSSLDAKQRFHARTTTNYHYKFFNLNVTVQNGSFYIGEIVNNYLNQTDNAFNMSINPSLRQSFFKGKLITEAGVNYYSNNVFGKSLQLNGRAEYEFIPRTILFTALNSNSFMSGDHQYRSNLLEVGITKKLKSTRIGSKNGTLEALVFKDINQNGIYDSTDSLATDYLIYINDVVFMTKKDGTIQYKNLPAGEYRISLPRLKGWYAPDQKINFEKKQRIEIPLQKTGTLRGTVSYDYNEFSYEIGQQKEGLAITAMGENGQSYLTRTATDGSYIFFIPTGKYTVRINTENLPPEIESLQGDQHAEIITGEVKSVNLVLNVKQRKIETKRFSSPSLRK